MGVTFIVTRYSEFLQAISLFACLNSNPVISKFNSTSEITPLVQICMSHNKKVGHMVSKISEVGQLLTKFNLGSEIKSNLTNKRAIMTLISLTCL
jgi:hypothetical protein